ncbi:MAG: 30S ribosome-binding factor RbfA [Acidimicrobiales bacterium]
MKGRRRNDRRYDRTERVNELLREILAERLQRIDDPRLELVSLTGVEVIDDIRRATVYFSALTAEQPESEVRGALEEHRVELQAAIGREARLRRTPELSFRPDSGLSHGLRVEEILHGLRQAGEFDDDAADDAAAEGRPGPGAP